MAMSITEKMKGISNQTQEKVKVGTQSLFLFVLKLASGLILGFTISLVVKEIFKAGSLSSIFVTLLIGFLFVKLTSSWRFGAIFIFDLIAVLVGLLLKMYIFVAP